MRTCVDKLFHQVADLSQEARAKYFLQNEVDSQTRKEVESLLAFDSVSDTTLNSALGDVAHEVLAVGRITEATGPLTATFPEVNESAPPEDQCGPYRLLRRLGRGGMGEVWLAERVDGIMKRPVAVKLPFLEYGADHIVERAVREREILAGLSHPGIARLYDAGFARSGRPYLALEYIEGGTITAYCDQKRLSVRGRLELFRDVLGAVQYAHTHLVIHRDIKPSNILVTPRGEVKLLDFGIAKLMREGEACETALTHLSGRAFTPDYASPEQAGGRDITTASDVYSLGMVLYELLGGDRPYQVDRCTWTPVDEVIQNVTVRALSQRPVTEETAAARSTTPARLAAHLRGELDAIVMKALDKEPERRYQTAEAFRADVLRYLAGQPVLAKPDSRWYRLSKSIRRHRWAVASAAAVFLALAGGLGLALWEARTARREARTSAAVQNFIEDIFRANSRDQPDPVKAQQTTARELLDLGAQKIERDLADAPVAKTRMLAILADLYSDLGMDDREVDLLKRRAGVMRLQPGVTAREIAGALTDLGMSMHASRSVNEREEVLLEAKSVLDKERDYKSTARAALSMALAEHYQSSDLNKALGFSREAVRLYRSHGPSQDLAEALFTQGSVQKVRYEMAAAERLFAEAGRLARKLGGDRNPALPRFYATHGEALQALMRFDEAEHRFRSAHQASLLQNGEDHPDTIQTGSRLGNFLALGSHFRDALPILEKARDASIRTRGASDPFYTPQAVFLYGTALYDYGRWEEGLEQITQAVENRRKNRPGTVYLGQMLEEQASPLIELGLYDRARAALAEALDIRKHSGLAVDMAWAAPQIRLALATGKLSEAQSLADQYGGDRAAGALSFPRLRQWYMRAQVSRAKRDFGEAIRLAAMISSEIQSSPNRPYLQNWELRGVFEEGQARLGARDPVRARPLLKRALELSGSLYDPKSPEIARIQIALANCDLDLGRPEEARLLTLQAGAIFAAHRQVGRHLTLPMRSLAARSRLPKMTS